MQEQLGLLQDLQELDLELRTTRKERKKFLEEQLTITAGSDKVQEMVDSLSAEISALEDQRKDLAQDLLVEQGNIKRAEERLPTIKTQKEYVALLKEVDSAKKMNKEIQDKVDKLDEQMAALASDRDEKAEELSALKSSVEGRQAEINNAIAASDKILGEGDDKRDGLLAGLPVRVRKRYEMLLDRRAGIAIVEARNGTCLGCHMHLPPQLFNSLFTAKEIMSCPHCNRMMFVDHSTVA